MEELKIELENCYGIKKLNQRFNFTTEHNVNVIYAKNGLMKTSLAKIFKKFQDGKKTDINDLIFGNTPVKYEIQIDGIDVLKEEIFVINSFEKAYESDSISSLLINESMRVRLSEIIRVKNNIFINLEDKSGLNINKAISTKGFLKLEEQVLKDFSFIEQSFLQNIESINLNDVDYDYSDIEYSLVFHKAVLSNIKKANFQSSILEYLEKSNEIYEEYSFFERGNFNLPKLKNIEKELKASSFFVRTNKIYLDGSGEFANLEALTNKIQEIELRLQETSAFKAIDKALGTKEGKFLKDLIENNLNIIEELTLANLENFKKKLWFSYLKIDENSFNILKENYIELREEISNLDINTTLWKKSINIFNDRFNLPFSMDINNPISSITGESLAKIIFNFTENGNTVSINRDELEKTNTLSQGEKRALYLLNIIFDIKKREEKNQKTLFIIDDVADLFDYKNKYAIIEYLNDISKIDNFYMIILSHNFDFYRTISSRLNLPFRQNRFHAVKVNDEIKIENEHYQNQPFINWKNNLTDKKKIIALIPFVRNLIKYGRDREINEFDNIEKDELFLTNLLHIKNDTKDIDFGKLKKVYLEYIGKDNFNTTINDTDKVYDLIIYIADTDISNDDINLENKIILALAIRLKSEEFMINKINNPTWVNNITSSQTRELFNKYSDGFADETNNIKILDSVNIMTPENIHLNSFMYEPLLDMDIVELKSLYNNVKSL